MSSYNPSISLEQMKKMLPRLSPAKAAEFFPHLIEVLDLYKIVTPHRIAAFFAQMGHESLDFTAMSEWPHRRVIDHCKLCKTKGPHAAGEQYEGRADLGNTAPGDGVKYKGRGVIQLTGKANYTLYGRKLGVDLVSTPELAEKPRIAFRVAAQYWVDRKCNEFADAKDFQAITKAVNGGFNGKQDRDSRYARNLGILGVTTGAGLA